ncbi:MULTISPECIES: twin-arginine translocation pathway signal protein [unclassified Pseudomonas]|uniref:twin-arginine translocation pathway signal protein n=1 Tax=unclassified Pseudomonas TaxID=196821 RepID=UPI000C88A28C|nr:MULTISPECIES: twin-arginine translocation pathway signal protein [unclassified Pseudomonas]PMZ87196.1 twin-arginine translocation pathway signal protein [Pseudomonas sp. FW215-T2]PNA12067.1 twin-arginine translocation pathway signal protein [Pseudomonas sp. FW215-R3]PNB37889.1 twin-arginine translocation pathway signal protein [Pseudomonas sp. FW305-131]
MTPSLSDTPALSRRGLLKFSLGATAFLATAGLGASLSGCSSSVPANGFVTLRSGDLLFLRALIPVMLEGAVTAERMPEAVNGTLKSLDYSLAHLSPEMLKLTQQLFDVLGMAVTRGPLTGIWGSWENASASDIQAFLDRWENSSLSLLRMGHSSLLQLVMMAWYGRKESWAHCGYPGPPTV